MGRVEAILVPTDFSDEADRALVVAVDLAAALGAHLHLIHVWQSPPPSGGCFGAAYSSGLALAIESEAREQLEARRQKVEAEGVAATLHLAEGDPSRQILAAARRTGVDWVVMGTRGRGALAAALLGSVTERVIRQAPCPVFAIGEGGRETGFEANRHRRVSAGAGGTHGSDRFNRRRDGFLTPLEGRHRTRLLVGRAV